MHIDFSFVMCYNVVTVKEILRLKKRGFIMNNKQFNNWAENMIQMVDYKRIFTYRMPDEECKHIVLCYDKCTGKLGVAKCHPNDKFNLVWGKAIATARCLGIEVPKINVEKKLSEMKYGEKFAGSQGGEFYFIAKHPVKIGQYIVLRIVDNHVMNFRDTFYEMVE